MATLALVPPPGEDPDITRLAAVLTGLGYDAEFCLRQPQDRDVWLPAAALLGARDAP